MSEIARDVTDAGFAADVLERSKQMPVVVDLWAPWCGPCRQLAPILEKIAGQRTGEFELVKINVDENPKVASQLGARSIPLVVGFRDGVVVSHFLGVQPESAINKFIDAVVPSAVDRLVSQALADLANGNSDKAESLLNSALETDSRHEGARIALARVFGATERFEEALKILSGIASTGHDEVATLIAELELKQAGNVDVASLEARVTADAADLEAVVALGKALAAGADYERALALLLGAVERDAEFDEGAAKQAMLDIFSVLGAQNPVTRDYRSKLSLALF